jgi:uridylate kinase
LYQYFVCGAWIPGASSDINTAMAGVAFGLTSILKVSNVDYVYDSDPRKNPDAKPLKKLTWDEYLKILHNISKHTPGASYPVDPLSAHYAKEHKLKFYFTSLDKFLSTEEFDLQNFDGTVIE